MNKGREIRHDHIFFHDHIIIFLFIKCKTNANEINCLAVYWYVSANDLKVLFRDNSAGYNIFIY